MATQEYFERKKAYVADYQKKVYTTFSFMLRKVDDREMIEFIRSQGNVSGYFRELVRKDMKRKKKAGK